MAKLFLKGCCFFLCGIKCKVQSTKYKVLFLIGLYLPTKSRKAKKIAKNVQPKRFGALLYEEACIGLPLKGAFVSRAYVEDKFSLIGSPEPGALENFDKLQKTSK